MRSASFAFVLVRDLFLFIQGLM